MGKHSTDHPVDDSDQSVHAYLVLGHRFTGAEVKARLRMDLDGDQCLQDRFLEALMTGSVKAPQHRTSALFVFWIFPELPSLRLRV